MSDNDGNLVMEGEMTVNCILSHLAKFSAILHIFSKLSLFIPISLSIHNSASLGVSHFPHPNMLLF